MSRASTSAPYSNQITPPVSYNDWGASQVCFINSEYTFDETIFSCYWQNSDWFEP